MEVERRHRGWQKVCKCVRGPGETIEVSDPTLPFQVCKVCGRVIVVIERRKIMENEVSFKTAERPKYVGRSRFPYERLRKSLLALQDTTKCVVLEDKEMNNNNLIFLRKVMKKEGWWVKVCKQDGKWHLWVVKEGSDE